MATQLVRAITLNDAGIWKGGSRMVLANQAPVVAPATVGTFPTKIEDVMSTTTFALTTGFSDFGATTDAGISVVRSWTNVAGIKIDQRDFEVRTGAITGVIMTIKGVTLDTSVERLQYLWGLGSITAMAAVAGTSVAQRYAAVGAINGLPSRICCILQQNDTTGKLRMFAFRLARPETAGDVVVSTGTAASNAFVLTVQPDLTQVDGSDFGVLYEQT